MQSFRSVVPRRAAFAGVRARPAMFHAAAARQVGQESSLST